MFQDCSLQPGGFGLADYPPGSNFGPRTIRDFEIVWFERGDGSWETDGVRIPCPAGSVVLARPGMRDGFAWDRERVTRHGYVHFDITAGVPQVPPAEWPLHRACAGADDILRPLLRHVIWLLGHEDPAARNLAAGALAQALVCFISGFDRQSGPSQHESEHPIVARAFDALSRRWTGARRLAPPPIAEWAADCGVSRGHFVRIIRQELGVPPQELLRLLRMDRGVMLLARSDLAVQDIAERCGFENPFHFSRCCRQVYGASPRALRHRFLEGGNVPTSPAVHFRRLSKDLPSPVGR